MINVGEDEFRKKTEWFYFLVGYAITRWAYVDRSLFEFCEFALGATERKTAAVFYRSPSIGDHLTLTDSLMASAELSPESLKRWGKVSKAIGELLPFRNDLAHNPPVQVGFIAVSTNKNDPSKSNVSESRNWLEIRTEPKKLLRPKTRAINATVELISEHIQKVEKVQGAIRALQWEVIGPPKGIDPTIPAPIFPDSLD